jgi:flavin-dependent dehydrogenase
MALAIHSTDADVIIIGGGIAGLGAALRLKDRGLEPLVLEAESRVGGRMTTDRVNEFVIDRGVTLLGNAFGSMRTLVKRLGLSSLVCKGKFSVGIQDAAGCRGYRGGRFEDLLFDRGISWRALGRPSFRIRLVASSSRSHPRLQHSRRFHRW